MHLHFKSSILDYIHLSPSSWSITTTTMKLCSILFTLLDFDKTNRLEEYHICALLAYLTNINQNQMLTIFYKLGRIVQIENLNFFFFCKDLDRSGAMELEEFFLLISLLIANKVQNLIKELLFSIQAFV